MKWNVSVLRRSGECERTEVADFELSEFFNRIASVEGKAWVLSVERVGDVGDSALVEPDGDELVSQLGKRRWRVMGDPEDGWWVEVDSNGNELPGDWEYDRKGGYVYCAFAKACEVFTEIKAVVPPEKESRVKDFRQMARYLCHMDQPDKHRYEMQDVVSIGSIDYASLCMSAADEDDMLDQIFETMDNYALDSYPKVVRWIREHNPEWKPIVYRKYTKQISEYAKGLHYESKQ